MPHGKGPGKNLTRKAQLKHKTVTLLAFTISLTSDFIVTTTFTRVDKCSALTIPNLPAQILGEF
jgi:hypothetical protein